MYLFISTIGRKRKNINRFEMELFLSRCPLIVQHETGLYNFFIECKVDNYRYDIYNGNLSVYKELEGIRLISGRRSLVCNNIGKLGESFNVLSRCGYSTSTGSCPDSVTGGDSLDNRVSYSYNTRFIDGSYISYFKEYADANSEIPCNVDSRESILVGGKLAHVGLYPE